MKKVVYFILVSLLVFTSCKKDASNPVNADTVPTPPTLASPTDTSANISVPVVLTWKESSGAKSYTLQVSASSSFSSFVFNKSDITSTTQQIPALNYLTVYYWRVNAMNSAGTSDWSKVWSFTIIFIPGTSTINYEGKTYHTVQIGTQCWLKENLDVGTMIQGGANQSNNTTIEKYCYDNNAANCTTYGGLYQWNEAMQYVTTAGTKGICPTGWHIPTKAELDTLKAAVNGDGNSLKAIGQGTGSGAGTNTSGFSALLAGDLYYYGNFYDIGDDTGFWSSTEISATGAYGVGLLSSGSGIYMGSDGKEYGFSIRCLKDN